MRARLGLKLGLMLVLASCTDGGAPDKAICAETSARVYDEPVAAETQKSAPPLARREDVSDVLHGVVVPDPYRWLEDEDDPEVTQWVEAQDAWARSKLDALPGRDAIRARIAMLKLDRPRDAIVYLKESVEILAQSEGHDIDDLVYALEDLATATSTTEGHTQAIPILERAVQVAAGARPHMHCLALTALGQTLAAAGRVEEATDALGEARRILGEGDFSEATHAALTKRIEALAVVVEQLTPRG